MNWFVKRAVKVGSKEDLDAKFPNGWSACDHVMADPSLAVRAVAECDSFGSDDPYIMCQACADASEEVMVVCHDCHREVPQKNTVEWRWYDFYAPQGDEPLTICNECLEKDRHKRRVQQDEDDRKEEESYYAQKSGRTPVEADDDDDNYW